MENFYDFHTITVPAVAASANFTYDWLCTRLCLFRFYLPNEQIPCFIRFISYSIEFIHIFYCCCLLLDNRLLIHYPSPSSFICLHIYSHILQKSPFDKQQRSRKNVRTKNSFNLFYIYKKFLCLWRGKYAEF